VKHWPGTPVVATAGAALCRIIPSYLDLQILGCVRHSTCWVKEAARRGGMRSAQVNSHIPSTGKREPREPGVRKRPYLSTEVEVGVVGELLQFEADLI